MLKRGDAKGSGGHEISRIWQDVKRFEGWREVRGWSALEA